jgi:hypothetical protein
MESNKRKKNTVKKQKRFLQFMLLTGFVGIVLFFIFAFTMFRIFGGDHKGSTKPQEQDTKEQVEQAPGKMLQMIGVVKKVDTAEKEMVVYDIEKEQNVSLQVDGTTELKDKYGQPMILAEFQLGQLIQTKYDEKSKKPEFLRLSAQGWEQKQIKDVQIHLEDKTIQVGNTNYQYTDEIIVYYKGQPIELKKIEPVDVVTLRGYKDHVWSVEMEKSHGYIVFSNTSKYTGALVEVDRMHFTTIEEVGKLSVEEGMHKVVVTQEGFEPFVKEVMVNAEDTTEINLSELKPKSGNLEVHVNVSDYEVFIDGVLYPANQLIPLAYGDYQITVQKKGYKKWNKSEKINSEYKRLDIQLEKVEQEQTNKLVTLSVDTNPSDAEVYIDDAFIGMSPVQTKVKYGDHNVTLRKKGYRDMRIPITIDTGSKKKDCIFTLQKDDNAQESQDPSIMIPEENINESY